ncbi:hypothetical protein VB773_04330 [Haloarculaceae archaeon H-GB2-1]|nr:hypothetical protein [Haloarculaceae archaeon H-GB1-1]MEA5388826.1 hypothetical protein [Haloarculaceae archaeon H-GB11]MEA5406883.1 hypothetical protein [Haloarculaceae archaeon H-GB2-1]
MLVPVQVGLTGGGLFAVVVTLLLAWVFYAVTLHLAAVFFIGEVPSQRAAAAALAPAVVSLLLQRYGPGVVVLVTLAADLLAIEFVYGLERKATVVLGMLHFAFAVALGFALNNLFGFV